MINKSLFVIFFVLATVSVTAQNLSKDDVIENRLLTPYDNYFAADREMVYTQFNKSRYLTGDDIWFTSWVLNPANKKLSFSTTKLYVELWSAEKKIISRKILYVKGGTASNFIHIEDSLTPGTYCFRAYTNWMRNFYEEKEFNSHITILGPTTKKINSYNSAVKDKMDVAIKFNETNKPEIKPDYDIQFLPESGHFIEGIDNVIGIKVTDPFGRGVSVKGKVVDTTNNEIVSFTTNILGMTNFMLSDVTNQIFRSIIELPDGSTREVKLPKPEKQGIAININAYRPDFVWLHLQINKLARSLNQSYILILHADGVIFDNYRIDFTTGSSVQFKIKKKNLGNGIIYATLFTNAFTPVTERIFYNQNKTLQGKISFSTNTLENDTVKLVVKATDSLSKTQFTKLSLSVLPGGTLMNHFTSNLLAESRLRPALKGDIENPGYYFEKYDTEHAIALDNLLMIQGWRKYDWPEIIKGTKPKFVYPSEETFTINGEVKNWLKNKPELKSRISLISFKNNLLLIAPVDNNGQFHFNKLFLVDSSYVIASASSINGTNWNRVLHLSIPETILKAPDFSQIQTPPVKQDEIVEDIPNMTKGVIQLAEVVVTAKMKDPFANNFDIGIMSRKFMLTKENYSDYNNVEDILTTYFNVLVTIDQEGKYKFSLELGATKAAQATPSLTIDGISVNDPIELISYPLNMVEAIAVDKSRTGGGFNGGGGAIALTSRKLPLFDMTKDASNIKRLFVKGYSAPKEYFEPRYLIQPENPDFSRYASIYWESELITDSTGVASFKFKVPQPLKSVVIRAEGINFDGSVFLHDEKIVLPGRE